MCDEDFTESVQELQIGSFLPVCEHTPRSQAASRCLLGGPSAPSEESERI